ncbi:hypothetical protein CDO81_27165 [Roseateles puraquae]|uniref:Uncharacterized protein n=1 Tax=Roseateles puraquae TaxID=431059 RepID=A0A254MXD5_9BURK|nr:hypothetical protein CDO81_27165 [Roseateles puraquae]
MALRELGEKALYGFGSPVQVALELAAAHTLQMLLLPTSVTPSSKQALQPAKSSQMSLPCKQWDGRPHP